jgi:hypothetical protein
MEIESAAVAKQKADGAAKNDQEETAAARQHVAKEGDRRRRRIRAVDVEIEHLGRRNPGGENCEKQKAEREDRGKRRRTQGGEGVAAARGEAQFAMPTHLEESDRDERPDQRKSGSERKRQLQRVGERGKRDQRHSGESVKQPEKRGIGWHLDCIAPTFGERHKAIVRSDSFQLRQRSQRALGEIGVEDRGHGGEPMLQPR